MFNLTLLFIALVFFRDAFGAPVPPVAAAVNAVTGAVNPASGAVPVPISQDKAPQLVTPTSPLSATGQEASGFSSGHNPLEGYVGHTPDATRRDLEQGDGLWVRQSDEFPGSNGGEVVPAGGNKGPGIVSTIARSALGGATGPFADLGETPSTGSTVSGLENSLGGRDDVVGDEAAYPPFALPGVQSLVSPANGIIAPEDDA